MSPSASPRPPARGLRVNISDLLNPVNPPSPDSAPPSIGRPLSSISAPASSAHIPILPSVSSIVDSPREHHTTTLETRSRLANTTDAAPQSRPNYPYASHGRQITLDSEIRPARRATQNDSSCNLRFAEWAPSSSNVDNSRPTLPPLQVTPNPKIEPWQSSPFSASPREFQYTRDTGDHIDKSENRHVLNRPIHRPVSSAPADSQRISPAAGFAAPHSVSRAVISIPHSPYGRQDQRPQQADYSTHPAELGPQPYSHLPPLAERLPVVGPMQSPTMSSSGSSPKHEYNGSSLSIAMDATETSNPTLQSSARASVRLVACRSKTPAPAATQVLSSVLQLHPDEQPKSTGRRRKRTHSNADLNGQHAGPLAPRSASLSSSSSADSPGSVNDRTENDEASRPKKVRGKADLNFSSGDITSATAQNRSAEAVNGLTKSSRKGKQKERSGAPPSHGNANGHFQPFPAQATIPHGYGVAVVPVREGLPPTFPVSFAPYPIPMQMHLHPMGPPVSYTAAQSQPFGVRLFPELQYARCMSARYKTDPFPRCVSCTRRWAGDTCRFQNIRILLRDANKTLWAVGFQDLDAKAQGPPLTYPDQWNVPLEKRHIDRIMETVASSLLPHLRKEQAHQRSLNVVRRQRETDVRATCDTCMTSLFSSSWMCRQCGREACEECYETIRRLTDEPSPASNPGPNGKFKVPTSPADQRAMKEKHAQANPFFLACNRKAEHGVHTFIPVTRFSRTELDSAVSGMTRLVNVSGESWQSPESSPVEESRPLEATGMEVDSSQGPSSSSTPFKRSNSETLEPSTGLLPEHYDDGICKLIDSPIPPRAGDVPSPALPPMSETPLETPTWPVPYYTAESLTEPVFAAQWARGTPLVVTGLLDRCKVSWTPEYFIKTYGAQSCLVLECQTDGNKKVTVAEYFSCFGKYEGRTECWKLKDWPPSTDFRAAFPELYEDFNRAVPVPSYTRRDGAYNIASHFPTNTIAPDLGPKMYNAYASSDTPGSKGSTRLHMDMADAVNVMLHAEPTADGAPGCAAWDIFRAEDSLALRQFLKKNFKGRYQNDPIHSQTFFLDPVLRVQLYEEFGVRSFRIYQRPGEAVFIPAGCAHQVCNLSDSIKAACDFVSPENVERCETLTREFRAQNQSLVWKEDVLQLRSMMWFAWLSCRRQQEQWTGQDSGLESAVAHATISNDEPDDVVMDTKQ